MRTISFYLVLSLVTLQAFSQRITGSVTDASTGSALVWVSLGVVDAPVGTITDENGHFSLELKGVAPDAVLRVTMIGYKRQSFTIRELTGRETAITLSVEPVQLKEVVIKPSGKTRTVGMTGYTPFGGTCGWGGTGFGKGFEIGTMMDLGSVPVRINSLHMHLYRQSFDSCIFRLHIRAIENSMPGRELLDRNIYLPVMQESGWVVINLARNNLVFRGEVALTVEWVRVKGLNKKKMMRMTGSKEPMPVELFSQKTKQGCIFSRWGSEAKWTRKEQECPSFYLTIEE